MRPTDSYTRTRKTKTNTNRYEVAISCSECSSVAVPIVTFASFPLFRFQFNDKCRYIRELHCDDVATVTVTASACCSLQVQLKPRLFFFGSGTRELGHHRAYVSWERV